jgi:hypothetical protein
MFGIIGTFLVPISGIIYTLLFFTLLDTVFGIYRVIRMEGVKGLKSTKLFNVVVKLFFYLGATIGMFFIDKFILNGTKIMNIEFILTKAMAVSFIYIEVKSMDETSVKLGNRSIWVVFAEMIRKFKQIKKDIKNDD